VCFIYSHANPKTTQERRLLSRFKNEIVIAFKVEAVKVEAFKVGKIPAECTSSTFQKEIDDYVFWINRNKINSPTTVKDPI
jgi:hypothetical protein